MARFLLQIVCAVLALKFCAGAQYILDLTSDLDQQTWKIWGDVIYVEPGLNHRRRIINCYLGSRNKNSDLNIGNGTWAVIPRLASKTEPCFDQYQYYFPTLASTLPRCDYSASAKIQFTLPDQAISSVKFLYVKGGNATITVAGKQHAVALHTYARDNEWKFKKVKFDGETSMVLELIVTENDDYVLIDRIEVETMEPCATQQHTENFTNADSVIPFTPSKLRKSCVTSGVSATDGDVKSIRKCSVILLYFLGSSFYSIVFY